MAEFEHSLKQETYQQKKRYMHQENQQTYGQKPLHPAYIGRDKVINDNHTFNHLRHSNSIQLRRNSPYRDIRNESETRQRISARDGKIISSKT